MNSDQPSAADSPREVADDIDEAALAVVMRQVPLGAGFWGGVGEPTIGVAAPASPVPIPRGTIG